MTSDVEVHIKQRCVIEFLCVENMAPIDIHQHLLNVYGDQAAIVSRVRWWVVHFSSGNSDSGSPLLVLICTNAACRPLFLAGESAQLMVVTVLNNSVFQFRIFSVEQYYCALCICCSFHGNEQEALLPEQFTYVNCLKWMCFTQVLNTG